MKEAPQVRLRTLRRRARLLFLPAYAVEYTYGEIFDANGKRAAQHFQAIIGGLSDTTVAAERHYSPQKVRHPLASLRLASSDFSTL